MYCCDMKYLFAILEESGDPELEKEAIALRSTIRRGEDGLLSVGLKIHVMPEVRSYFDELIHEIGEYNKCDDNLGNLYRSSRAWLTLVLPPVGSARAAIRLVRAIGRYVRLPLFGSKDTQIQVCTPGKLSSEDCAILGAGFYLSSQRIRSYPKGQFWTTASNDNLYHRGERLVLYDASGSFDADFPWWHGTNGSFVVSPALPFKPARTDILVGITDPQDIANINLIGSLLAHREYCGAWAGLGAWYAEQVRAILARHELAGVLAAPWVCPKDHMRTHGVSEVAAADKVFATAFNELSGYALSETVRCAMEGAVEGILHEMQELMRIVRYCVETRLMSFGQDVGDTQ